MTKRKLPSVGDTVAYTRDALHGSSARADWRGVIVRPCDYATADWPMVTVLWRKGRLKGCRVRYQRAQSLHDKICRVCRECCACSRPHFVRSNANG